MTGSQLTLDLEAAGELAGALHAYCDIDDCRCGDPVPDDAGFGAWVESLPPTPQRKEPDRGNRNR